MYDVVVVGAGVIGCAIARELSKYELEVVVVEKCLDVCEGTSKANSGIVHAGFDAKSGSNKARFNVEGNRMIRELHKVLDFHFVQNGSLVLCFDKNRRGELERLKEQGEKNGVEGLRIISGDEARRMEPELSDEVTDALYAPTGGIVCPFGMTIAFAENAAENGAGFVFGAEVFSIDKGKDEYILHTSKGSFNTRAVINAAGVNSDDIHNMVSDDKIYVGARKGEYCLFDKEVGNKVSATIFQLPTKLGKGVLVTPTVHGNLLIGPNAADGEDKEETCTTKAGLDEIVAKAGASIKNVPMKKVITSFAGLRAHSTTNDFIIGEVEDAPMVFDAAGIESPGLTSAPAIGKHIAEMVAERLGAERKESFKEERKGIFCMSTATREEKEAKIKEDSRYANVICRCEGVTEGEIRDAVRRTPGATTIDGIKRRTRAGMGRCQAGFCLPKTMEILSEEMGVSVDDIVKSQGNSKYLFGDTKGKSGKGNDNEL